MLKSVVIKKKKTMKHVQYDKRILQTLIVLNCNYFQTHIIRICLEKVVSPTIRQHSFILPILYRILTPRRNRIQASYIILLHPIYVQNGLHASFK